ncbi:NAD(P)-dependent oxidoreductase [Acidaminobacter hydrogenoformans]|uniref:3-hydroxyisobutyrate dehydrogenase n=1 Tax=Acidaminobacter hydrogenoformans DSM 2784 TaxID=1120920 RepID=A0A1G5S365_9FIRM|nr:NAD(P)-binding domain-containing protein [Acidaminobacter hydrogenoformans]SCZ80191.1 3-hydroxyisobutyrate dehydrogenase [Acidaminobacter hydrogenoformans DSM 2784]
MKIGFIGFGEAAYCISLGLREEGIHDIVAYDVMVTHPEVGKVIENRAAEAGVTLLGSNAEVVRQAELLFVAVPSSYAMDVCNEIYDDLRVGQIYADVSASTPTIKQQVWGRIQDKGVLFVDAAMLGSLPLDKHKVPIMASGNGAEALHETMTPYGMRITCASDKAGDASAIKLIRSIFMKGLAGLMLEMLQASEHYQVSDQVVKSIGKSLDGIAFQSHLDRLITGTAIHAKRRAAEIKGSILLCSEAGIDCPMTVASKDKHDLLASYEFPEKFHGVHPKQWQEILSIMK